MGNQLAQAKTNGVGCPDPALSLVSSSQRVDIHNGVLQLSILESHWKGFPWLQMSIVCWHLKHSICTLYVDIWSTPYVHYLLTSGVLHMSIICWHLEYSICTWYVDIWSTPYVNYMLTSGVLHMYIICWHLEYSICQLYVDIWSTPYVHFLLTSGVLQM